MKSIPYGRQYITDEDKEAVVDVLGSDFLTQGKEIPNLEEKFADYVGAKFAVAVSNGTAALHLSALALGVEPRQKIITSPITFSASANCVRYCDGEVTFCDIDPTTYSIDLNKVEAVLKNSPRGTYNGIIPVDFTGLPVNLERLREIADEHGLWILEDACHAPGAFFEDSHGDKQYCGNGNFAELAIFSFHPVKHIAAGEGGMITTNDEGLYNQLLELRTHGITKRPERLNENHGGWYYELQSLGYNYRLTDIQAALANSQLQRADQMLAKRHEIAKRYDEAFQDLGIVQQKRSSEFSNAFHLYVIEVDNRKAVYDQLREKGIYAQVHYVPVHFMPYYQQFGWSKGDLPIAEAYYSRCLSLPMYPSLSLEDQEYVIATIKALLS